ncbi:MAG: YfcE family phosphodiesterase [Candidatus Moranbacteria bacterium]|nr:YfcE family phosphodiesterase [Candidatus Moranbacteria bacterium]
MRIAIISDIHNNEVNLKKVLNYCKNNKIETIICCGDLASKATLDLLNDNFSGTVHYTFGNMDKGQIRDFALGEKYKNTTIYKNYGEIEIKNNHVKPTGHATRRIAFAHYPKIAKELCETGNYHFVFYGHTHKPWTEKIGNCIMLNPGNVAGEIFPPTFAVWDTGNDKFALIRIHSLK